MDYYTRAWLCYVGDEDVLNYRGDTLLRDALTKC